MDLVQLREESVTKDVPPMEKARLFMMHKAAWNLSHSQWLFFTFPLPKEVEDAIIFFELPSSKFQLLVMTCVVASFHLSLIRIMKKADVGEQQRQIQALQTHLERNAEDMLAERKLGTALHAFYGKQAHLTIIIESELCHMQAISKQNETSPMFEADGLTFTDQKRLLSSHVGGMMRYEYKQVKQLSYSHVCCLETCSLLQLSAATMHVLVKTCKLFIEVS